MLVHMLHTVNLKFPLNIRGKLIVLHAIVGLRQSQSLGGN